MPGTGKDGEARRSNVSFTGRVPQAKMATVRITQGTQGRHHRELIGGTCESRTFTGPPFCRKRSIHKTAPRLTRAEIESTSQGPWKLLTKNCINAKETPATSATTGDVPAFGWSGYAERVNGRFAMVGFVAVLLIEALSGDTFLHWAGLVP